MSKISCVSLFVISLAIVFPHTLWAEEKELDIQTIAKKNVEAFSKIKSFILDVDNELETKGEKPSKRKLYLHCRWLWQGDETKWMKVSYPQPENDREPSPPATYLQEYENKDEYWTLGGFDPENPPKLKNEKDGLLSHVAGRISSAINVHKKQMHANLFWTIENENLSDLIAKNPSKLLTTPANSAEGCYEIEITLEKAKKTYRLYVDPRKNYSLRKYECYHEDKSLWFVNEVISFQDCPMGILVPKECKSTIYQNDPKVKEEKKNIFVTYTTFKVIKMNEKISPETLAIDFPEWIPVNNEIEGKMYIWGKPKPHIIFNTPEEFREWEQTVLGYGPPGSPPPRSKL